MAGGGEYRRSATTGRTEIRTGVGCPSQPTAPSGGLGWLVSAIGLGPGAFRSVAVLDEVLGYAAGHGRLSAAQVVALLFVATSAARAANGG